MPGLTIATSNNRQELLMFTCIHNLPLLIWVCFAVPVVIPSAKGSCKKKKNHCSTSFLGLPSTSFLGAAYRRYYGHKTNLSKSLPSLVWVSGKIYKIATPSQHWSFWNLPWSQEVVSGWSFPVLTRKII